MKKWLKRIALSVALCLFTYLVFTAGLVIGINDGLQVGCEAALQNTLKDDTVQCIIAADDISYIDRYGHKHSLLKAKSVESI